MRDIRPSITTHKSDCHTASLLSKHANFASFSFDLARCLQARSGILSRSFVPVLELDDGGSSSRPRDEARRIQPRSLFVLFLDGFLHFLHFARADQRNRASAESTAGHARSE